MGVVLVAVGGFLVGGTVSLWRQAGESGTPPVRSRQLRGFATALAVCAVLAVVAGVLRIV